MRNKHKHLSLVYVLWVVFCNPSHGEDAPSNINCLMEMELPQFAVAQRVPQGGSLEAVVTVGPNGKAADVQINAADRNLASEVAFYLRQRATYARKCAGKKVHLQFTFRIEDEPRQCTFARMWFRPPNHFVISTQLALPTVDYFPVRPKQEQPNRRH